MNNYPNSPMQTASLANALRCGARTRAGHECRSPAVKGKKRCRMHGGTNPGAPKGNRRAWKHGNRSAEAEEQLRMLKATDRDLRILTKVMRGLELRVGERERLIDLQRDARSALCRDQAKRGTGDGSTEEMDGPPASQATFTWLR